MSVVPEVLRCAAGVPDTGLAAGSYCMNASLMLFQRHGWDIHAVRPGAGVASVTEALSRCTRHGRHRPAVRSTDNSLADALYRPVVTLCRLPGCPVARLPGCPVAGSPAGGLPSMAKPGTM